MAFLRKTKYNVTQIEKKWLKKILPGRYIDKLHNICKIFAQTKKKYAKLDLVNQCGITSHGYTIGPRNFMKSHLLSFTKQFHARKTFATSDHIIYEKSNHCLLAQNGIWVKFYHFWPKNDDEKWSRKNIFEIPSCGNPFSDPFIYFIKR